MTKYVLVPLEELMDLKRKEMIYSLSDIEQEDLKSIKESIVDITEEDISFEYEIIEK